MTRAVTTKEEILQVIHQNLSQILALGVKRVGLFGSFVRGEQHVNSDVDLLVEFEQGQKTFDHFIPLSFLLEDSLGRTVELVTGATSDSTETMIRMVVRMRCLLCLCRRRGRTCRCARRDGLSSGRPRSRRRTASGR